MKIFNKIINFFKNIFGQDIKVITTKKAKDIVEKNKNCTISIVNGDNNKKEINANIIVEKNKDCEINIINKEDELSFDSIYKNAYDIDTLEENFNNRIEFSNNQVSKLLPKELQNDFKIEAKMKIGDLQYETITKTK